MNKLLMFMVTFTLLLWGSFLWEMADKVHEIKAVPNEKIFSDSDRTIDFKSLLQRLSPQAMPTKDLRDPFELPKIFTPVPKYPRTNNRGDKKSATEPNFIPEVTLDAILPGDNPVAILKYHGESSVASVGQTIWGVTVVGISQSEVTLRFDGKTFKIK